MCPTPDNPNPNPCDLLATSASWASTWPAPARCRCWACSAPGDPDPCGLPATPASRASIWPAPARCPVWPRGLLPGAHMRPSIWPAPTRCRCWTRPAPGDSDPCGLPATPASRASTWPALTRCRYWMCRPALQHRGLSATPAYPHHVFMLNFCLFGWLRPRFPSGSGPPCGALRMQSELSTSRSTAIPQFLAFDCGKFYSIKSTS